MAGIFIHATGEPADDLFEARGLSLAGGRAQGCIGGEQDPGLLRNIGPLAELAQRNDVGFAAADRGPVAARVLEQLVGGGEPQRPAAAAQPVVEDDGGDLAALAATGAIAQHPAAPQTHRRGQGFAVAGGIGGGFKTGASGFSLTCFIGDLRDAIAVIAVVIFIVGDACDGLPALADAVERGKMAAVGLTGEDDAFQLRVGQQFVRHDTHRQHRAVGRHGMGHRRHGGGLHQGCWMFAGAGNARGPGPPGLVDAGMGCLRFVCRALSDGGRCLVGEFGHRPPIADLRGCGSGVGRGGHRPLSRGRPCGGMAEQIAGRNKRSGYWHDRLPLRHIGGDGCKQPGSGGDGFPRVDRNAGCVRGITVDHGEPGIEGRAAPCVGAPVDCDGKNGARRWIEAFEGAAPGGIAGYAAGRRDRHQPPARRKHGEGGTEVTQIRVVTGALDPGARRERRVHQHHGGMQVRQIVADGLRVVAGDRRVREQSSKQPGADGGDLVQVQGIPRSRVICALAERAFGHDGEHAGAGRGLEHDVAGPDGGGLQRGVGERQGGGELLQGKLFLRPPCLGRLQGRQGLQHGQHGGGRSQSGAGLAAHEAAVTLDEQHHRGLGRFVGVLPDPGALRVTGAEGRAHGFAQGLCIERPARLQLGKQSGCGGQQRGRLGADARGIGNRWGWGKGLDGGRTRGRVRRRLGVEHE